MVEKQKKAWPVENGHTHNMTVRVPQAMYNQLRERARIKETTITKIVVEAIEDELQRPIQRNDPKKGGRV